MNFKAGFKKAKPLLRCPFPPRIFILCIQPLSFKEAMAMWKGQVYMS